MEKITQGLDRLSLHDSSIEEISRTQNQLVLTFDWAKLGNYQEIGLNERIIIGKCKLTFGNVQNENLRLDFSGTPNINLQPKEIEFNRDLFINWLVLQNDMDNENHFCIGGLLDYEDICGWLDWEFSFSNFKLEWNKHITWDEWQDGKLVNS